MSDNNLFEGKKTQVIAAGAGVALLALMFFFQGDSQTIEEKEKKEMAQKGKKRVRRMSSLKKKSNKDSEKKRKRSPAASKKKPSSKSYGGGSGANDTDDRYLSVIRENESYSSSGYESSSSGSGGSAGLIPTSYDEEINPNVVVGGGGGFDTPDTTTDITSPVDNSGSSGSPSSTTTGGSGGGSSAPTLVVPIDHAYAKVSQAWTHEIPITGGTPNYACSLTSGPSGMTINTSTCELSYTPPGLGDVSVTVAVSDSGSQSVSKTFVLHITSDDICVWNGSVSTAWSLAENWDFCNGGTPGPTMWIAIDSTPINQPILASSVTVIGVGDSELNGGVVTINSGVTLSVTHATTTFQSDVGFKGAVSSCTDCTVATPLATASYVINDAVLSLGAGVKFLLGSHRRFYLGNGSTSGHLKADNSSVAKANWPKMTRLGIGDDSHYGIELNGTAANKSSIYVDGLHIAGMHDADGSVDGTIFFNNNYRVQKMDNLVLEVEYTGINYGIKYENCSNGVFQDTTWDNVEFDFADPGNVSTRNVIATCNSGAINFTNHSGNANGATKEDDTFNVINWL
jgi:hypothetical protein